MDAVAEGERQALVLGVAMEGDRQAERPSVDIEGVVYAGVA